jgi:hypothetical protein
MAGITTFWWNISPSKGAWTVKKTYVIFLIVAAFLLGTMAGGVAGANQTIKIFINGREKVPDQPPMLLNDRTFVPLRFISENMGATVAWDEAGNAVKIDIKPKRPAIIGDAEFVKKVSQALDLLEEKAYPHYYLVCSVGWPIEWRKDSGYELTKNALASVARDKIVVYGKLTGNIEKYNAQYLAGVIIHEATHALNLKLDNEKVLFDFYLSEKIAHENELTVYRLLNAPKWMQDEPLNWEQFYPNIKQR